MTHTTYNFRNFPNRNYDHYAAYASKRFEHISFWEAECIRFFQIQFNLLQPTQNDLNTNPNDIITSPSVKNFQYQTYRFFLERNILTTSFFKITKLLRPVHSTPNIL